MSNSKTNNLNFLSNQLTLIDKDLIVLNEIQHLPFCELKIYNASDKKFEIKIDEEIKEDLKSFLTKRMMDKKDAIYSKMKKELEYKDV